jgi:hypothetical protein
VIEWRVDPKELVRQINLLMRYMNEMYGRLDLPEAMRVRIAQEVAQRLGCGME